MADTLVLGLGNELLGDDGVGLRAARRVAELAGPLADHAEACVATIDLLPLLGPYRQVVVLDAWLRADQPPGTRVHVAPEALPPGFGYRSPHTMPFRDILALGRELGLAMPERVSIHGLSVADPWTFGTILTPAVAAAWPAWAEEIARAEFGNIRPEPCQRAVSRIAGTAPGSRARA